MEVGPIAGILAPRIEPMRPRRLNRIEPTRITETSGPGDEHGDSVGQDRAPDRKPAWTTDEEPEGTDGLSWTATPYDMQMRGRAKSEAKVSYFV